MTSDRLRGGASGLDPAVWHCPRLLLWTPFASTTHYLFFVVLQYSSTNKPNRNNRESNIRIKVVGQSHFPSLDFCGFRDHKKLGRVFSFIQRLFHMFVEA